MFTSSYCHNDADMYESQMRVDKCVAVVIFRLDKKNVVFGQIVGGMEVLTTMNSEGTNSGDPKAVVKIKKSGLA